MYSNDNTNGYIEYDMLTKINNRYGFVNRARRLISENPNTVYVIVRFDIDNFKIVNDMYGYDEGDRVLCYVADSVRNVVENGSVYGRIDSDNFAICFPYSQAGIDSLISGIDGKLRAYTLSFGLCVNYGLYVVDNKELTIEAMLDRATMAQRSIKGNYICRYAYYDEKLKDMLYQERWIHGNMYQALMNNEFEIWLQPKCKIDTGEIIGAEALARWNHPEKGLLVPEQFIPTFEKSGFIMKLDMYIWEEVCKLIRKWIDNGITANNSFLPVPVSSNVSRINIYNPRLCDTLKNLVSKYDIPKSLFELEITESAYSENSKLLEDVMDTLHSEGFSIHMDDFGSGYSSLSMLKDICIDVLKIDMRFLYMPDKMGRGGRILTAVTSMARELGLDIVAEGIETEDQANFLFKIGCNEAQGYYFYKPMPVSEFEKLIMKK